LWRKKIGKGSPNVQDGKGIIQDSATKKIAIVGYQYLPTNNKYGFNSFDNIVILDSLGNYVTSTSRIIGLGGLLVDVIQTRDKKIVACGTKIVSTRNSGITDMVKSYALKFDINFPQAPIWIIDGYDSLNPGNSFGAVNELPNGDLLFAGFIDTSVYSTAVTNFHRITKCTKDGNIIWSKYYNYHNPDQAMFSISRTSDNGMISAINQANLNSVNPFFFVKYDADGCDSTLAYCALLLGEKKIPNEREVFSIYPNPTNEMLNVTLNYPSFASAASSASTGSASGSASSLSLKITDISGKQIELIKIESNEKLQLNTAKYEAGIYFVSILINGNAIETKKLVIVR
jgi:hypothetical protein